MHMNANDNNMQSSKMCMFEWRKFLYKMKVLSYDMYVIHNSNQYVCLINNAHRKFHICVCVNMFNQCLSLKSEH